MSWQQIRGHDALVQEFARVVQKGRVAHAYLFIGPPGVGKRLFATELAKVLLCEAPGEQWQACDRCPSCLLVEAGTHPDLIAVGRPEDKNELPIEGIRELCRRLSLKAARGSRKVAIVDHADDMSEAAANCFLKTLEEPPPGSLLILIGTSSELQLATIRSRCQVVHFAPLPALIIAELLAAQGATDASLIERVVRLCNGSPGQALALADPALCEFRGDLVKALASPKFDSVGLGKAWLEFIGEAGKESGQQRRRASLTLRLLIDFLTDVMRVSVGAAAQWAESGDLTALQSLADRIGSESLVELIDRCLQADHQVDRYVQLVLVIEALADALAQKITIAT